MMIISVFVMVALLPEVLHQHAQAFHGGYCGGEESVLPIGRMFDVSVECKDQYGPNATAAVASQDIGGWVCRVPGQRDRLLDVQRACRHAYGDKNAFAVLRGITVNDWWCLKPSDISGYLVPILLVPREKAIQSEVFGVKESLTKVDYLMAGVRHFYFERTYARIRGTKPFVHLTSTTVADWKQLASERVGTSKLYHVRVLEELVGGPWITSIGKHSVRVGAFVYLGYPPPPLASGLSNLARSLHFLESALSPPAALAVGRTGFTVPPAPHPDPNQIFSLFPYASYINCNVAPLPPQYEKAFYEAGHGFGKAIGLPRSDQYPFGAGGTLIMPTHIVHSIMYNGNGTKSLLFPFEASRALQFFMTWQ
jgi:hypothetical protein